MENQTTAQSTETRLSQRPVRGRVLIVDDDPALVRAYGRILKSAGYAVATATDGEAAVASFRDQPSDVVFTDISMPGMGGMGLLRAVHDIDEEVPVVLATGGPTVETAIQAMDDGALKYLVKPVDPAALLEVIERAVHLSRMAVVKRQAAAVVLDFQHKHAERAELEAGFDRALGGLFMHYQPIVRWSDRHIYGYEALVRCKEPTIPHPGVLFAAAESLGRVMELGRAIRAIAPAPLAQTSAHLFINLHPKDLSDDALLDPSSDLASMADRIVLEITERASLGDVPDARNRIAALREIGYRIAVDDLGAGYAGLASFAMLEPDVAKLDMAIVRDVHLLPTKQKLVKSMCDLCRDMGMPLVAEGVECTEERDVLVALGCDLFQGYLFAKPAPAFPDITW